MELLSTNEVADKLDVTVRQVQKLIESHEIRAHRIGRDYVIPYESLLDYLNKPRSEKDASMAGRGASRFKLDYWTAFSELLKERGKLTPPRKLQPEQWMAFRVGPDCRVAAHFRMRDPLIGVDLTLGRKAKDLYEPLKARQTAIEKKIFGVLGKKFSGSSLEWEPRPNAAESWILIRRNADPKNREDWRNQHEWLAELLERFHDVFKNEIQDLRSSTRSKS